MIRKIHISSQKPHGRHLFTLQLQANVKTMQGCGFVNFPSLLYHSYLVCTLFGMPSLHPFTFLMFLSLSQKGCSSYRRPFVSKLVMTTLCKKWVTSRDKLLASRDNCGTSRDYCDTSRDELHTSRDSCCYMSLVITNFETNGLP